MYNKVTNISAKVDQNFLWWMGNAGNMMQASGAYVFNPVGTTPHEICPVCIVKTTIIKVFLRVVCSEIYGTSIRLDLEFKN